MARQIVRESFYIYCNRFKEFIPFGCIVATFYFTLSCVSSLLFLLGPLLIITCEIPCYSLFCNKRPIQALRENPKPILFFSICDIAVVLASRYSFTFPEQIMNFEIEISIAKLLLNVIFTILQVSVSFLLIHSIKKNCGIKEAFSKYADVFSSNRAWKVWLYVKVCLVEFGYMLVLIAGLLVITFLMRTLLQFPENLAITITTIFFLIFVYVFYPYMYIRMCNYCEEIC